MIFYKLADEFILLLALFTMLVGDINAQELSISLPKLASSSTTFNFRDKKLKLCASIIKGNENKFPKYKIYLHENCRKDRNEVELITSNSGAQGNIGPTEPQGIQGAKGDKADPRTPGSLDIGACESAIIAQNIILLAQLKHYYLLRLL